MEDRNEIPREIVGSRHSKLIIYITVNKKLMADISNQSKTPHAIVSADTSNCFNRVAYLISALSCMHFSLKENYIQTFFETIQNIKMYLLTTHGLSDTYYTGSLSQPFQGLIQGNGTASPSFMLIVILLIRSLYFADLVPTASSPISHCIYHLAGQIFVDDSDFNIMNQDREDK